MSDVDLTAPRTAAERHPRAEPGPGGLAGPTVARVDALGVAWLFGYASERTRRAYRLDLGDFRAWCARERLDPLAVRRAHIDAYARELAEGRGQAPATVARRLAALSSFYGYGVAEGVLERNPVARVRRPAVSRDASATVGLTRAEARALLAAATADGARSWALVTLLLANGLRVGEALGADVADLGTARGHRTLTLTGKGAERATVPLAPRRSQRSRATWAGAPPGRCSPPAPGGG